MRKILTSVLSVAGLLAVVLALATSPASADKQVVTISSPADDTAGGAGTYTVSWETQGGCDPGAGTSGASGSVTLTVAEGDTAGQGEQVETGVVIDDICNYTWSASLVNSAGADCRVNSPVTGTDGDIIDLALVDGGCATTGKLAVTVRANGTEAVAGVDDNDDGDFDDGGDTAPVESTQAEADLGAVKNTVFTVTATPEKASNGKVPEGCNTVSEETEINYGTNEQDATLTVVDDTLGGASCTYTVTAALPAGFAAGGGETRSTANSDDEVNPLQDDGNTADVDEGTVPVDDLLVSIASVQVYLVQNVIGDAGGASATYTLSTPCGAPGLPAALTARSESGGITPTKATNVVELRTGSFEVTAALTEVPSDYVAGTGVPKTALNAGGDSCEATVAVSGVPDGCSADGASAALASASGSVRLDVTVDCTPPPAPEPEPEPEPEPAAPVDEGGDDDGMDMGGDDDAGDMGGDDDAVDEPAGPIEDTPTG